MRLPEIVRWFDIASVTFSVGSASGGLLYVTLPPNLQLGPVAIHWYGLTYLAAFGLFLFLGLRRLQHHPQRRLYRLRRLLRHMQRCQASQRFAGFARPRFSFPLPEVA